MKKELDFLRIALKDRNVSALAESSQHLVEKALQDFSAKHFVKVIEYGPGSGAMTRELLRRIPQDGQLIVIESNHAFIEVLKNIQDSRLQIISGEIQDVVPRLKKEGLKDVNLIVSSIPFSLLSKEKRGEVLLDSFHILSDDGSFVAFHQYVPVVAWALRNIFESVKTFLVFRNLFPCFVIVAHKTGNKAASF